MEMKHVIYYEDVAYICKVAVHQYSCVIEIQEMSTDFYTEISCLSARTSYFVSLWTVIVPLKISF